MAKTFKTDPSDLFITKPKTAPEDYVPPAGYHLVPDVKSARLQLLVTPAIKNNLVRIAKERGTSVNQLSNDIFAEYIENSLTSANND